MANIVNIPYLQTPDPNVNQIQQNANRVFNNLNSQITSLQSSVSGLGVLGEVRFSPLTLTQFQALTSTDWILANGQSCVNTSYAKNYLKTTVPTVSITGLNAFIRVN